MVGVKLVLVEIHREEGGKCCDGKGRFAMVVTWAAEDVQESDRLYLVKEW